MPASNLPDPRRVRIARGLKAFAKNETSSVGAATALAIFCLVVVVVWLFPADKSVRSRPNSQGGQTYYFNDGRHPIQCRPNSQGGQTCHAI